MPPPAKTQEVQAAKNRYPTMEDVIAEPEKSWNALYLKGQIASAEETLHLQEIWQRFGRAGFALGIVSLWSIAVISDGLNWRRFEPWIAYLYIAAIIVTVASPVFLYLQYKKLRSTRLSIRKLNILLREKLAQQDKYAENASRGPLVKQQRYRDDLPEVIAQMRGQAARLRAIHNRYQAIIIVGSILASAITTASVSFGVTRWISVGVTAAVGLAAGFTGYYKFHDNSYNLQQTADAIEREYEAVELRVGRYVNLEDAAAYSLFADTVERLRDEQNKRQQQLDQPVEAGREETATTGR
jgi:hypothetical protein